MMNMISTLTLMTYSYSVPSHYICIIWLVYCFDNLEWQETWSQRKWNVLTRAHLHVVNNTITVGLPREAAADVITTIGRRDLVPAWVPMCIGSTRVGSLEPGECWYVNTAWRMPHHQWRHRSWGAAVLVPGWLVPKVAAMSVGVGADSTKLMDWQQNWSSIGYTRRVNFIVVWTLEILNYLRLVEFCIPVNMFFFI